MSKRKDSRGARGDGSIRQRERVRYDSNGKKKVTTYWEGRFTIGRDPATGRQIQKSISGGSQNEVRKRLKAITRDIDDGTYIEPSKLTLGQWLDIWLRDYTNHIKENTRISYETQVRQHIKPHFATVKLVNLSKHAVQNFINSLERRDKPLSPKTIKNIHGVLNTAMTQAIEVGYIRTNPCAKARLPKLTPRPIQPLDDESVAAFLGAIKGQPLENLFKVALFTGLRQSEIMGLTWKSIDFKRGTILVDKQLIKEKKKGGIYKLAPTKNDKSRTLTLAPSVMRLLHDHKRKQAEWQLRAGQAWQNDMNLVFTNELGQHYAHNTLSRSFKRIAVTIGLPDNVFHDLRHTFAVNSLQNGDDTKTLQENLGHHTAAFTLDTYGHVSERMKNDSADRMENYIKAVGGL